MRFNESKEVASFVTADNRKCLQPEYGLTLWLWWPCLEWHQWMLIFKNFLANNVTMWLGVLSPLVVSDSVILWTVAHQNPLSMGFPGKNTGMGCHFFLQEIFPAQRWNLRLLCFVHRRRILYPLSHRGRPHELHCFTCQWPNFLAFWLHWVSLTKAFTPSQENIHSDGEEIQTKRTDLPYGGQITCCWD